MTKKRSTIILAVSFCALIAASVVVFPLVIAVSPPNREIETIRAEELFPTEDAEASGDAESIADTQQAADSELEHADNDAVLIDINAISEEMAVGVAEEVILHNHELILTSNQLLTLNQREPAFALGLVGIPPRMFSSSFRSARYVESIPYIDAPVWQVLFYFQAWGYWDVGLHFGPLPVESMTAEEYMASNNHIDGITDCLRCVNYSWYVFDGLTKIIKSYTYESLVLIEVDAFSGEIVGMGELILSNQHGCVGDGSHVHKVGSSFSYDDAYDRELLVRAAAPTDTTLYWRYFWRHWYYDSPWYKQESGLTPESGPMPTPEPIPDRP